MSDGSTGHIEFLELLNFKSYKGKLRIGPMRNFSAIVGPNGAGKSNLMDAISFVLGIRTDQLRGKLRELLYTDGVSDTSNHGYVEISYQSTNRDIRFRRSIQCTKNGTFTSEYSIDGDTKNTEQYLEHLASLGILVKARNFLVFQGDIESVAAMDGKELTRMLECVSGSIGFAKEYDRLLAEKEKAETVMMQLHGRKRNLLAEKKQKKEQMAEAQKHRSIEDRLRNEQLSFFAWKSYMIEKEIDQMHESITTLDEKIQAEMHRRKISQTSIAKKREEFAKLTSSITELEESIQSKRRIVEETDPDLIRISEEQTRLEKRHVLTRSKLSEQEQRLEAWKKAIKKLQCDLEEMESAQRRLEEVVQEEELQGVSLNEQDLSQYYEIKNRIVTLTGRLQQEKSALDASQSTLIEARNRHRSRCENLAAQISQLQEAVNISTTRIDQDESEKTAVETEINNYQTKKLQVQRSMKQESSRRQELLHELEEVERQISEGKASKRETRRDSRIAESISRMKSIIPGVYGRITDLGRIRQSKYNLAMAVALGSELDSVLVDCKETAKSCIQFLKENKYFPLSFYPLDSVSYKPINENLRKLGGGGSIKLAFDLIDFDPKLLNGFLAIGVKIVSLDGTIIHKTGYITGGLTESMESRAARWDDKKLTEVRNLKVKLEDEFHQMRSERDWKMEDLKLDSQLTQFMNHLKNLESGLYSTRQTLEEKQVQLNRAQKDDEKTSRELQTTQEELDMRQQELDRVKVQIDEIADREFRDFSTRLGVQNYREYEELHLKKAKENGEKRKNFEVQISYLKSQLEYETSRDLETPVRELKEKIKEETKKLKLLQKEAQKKNQVQTKLKSNIEVIEQDYQELKNQIKTKEIELKELKNIDNELLHSIRELETSLASKKSKEHYLSEEKKDLFQTTTLELGTEMVPDFSLLSAEIIAEEVVHDLMAKEQINNEFHSRINELQSELNRSVPNLKAFDQYSNIKDQETEELSKLEEAKKTEQKISKSFQNVHNQRLDLFMEAFQHISQQIDEIYRDLTKSDAHPYGGSASLYLESEDAPFLNGIKFSAIPPAKRYRDMEQLSGGEKTVIALSLLFAIHSYKPCPFFILDEIDASLDASNVDRVVDYIKKRTRNENGRFQSIVISLKDAFFHKADCLIGVTRDSQNATSEILTLDLEAMEQINDDEISL
eukprot:g5301.t1